MPPAWHVLTLNTHAHSSGFMSYFSDIIISPNSGFKPMTFCIDGKHLTISPPIYFKIISSQTFKICFSKMWNTLVHPYTDFSKHYLHIIHFNTIDTIGSIEVYPITENVLNCFNYVQKSGKELLNVIEKLALLSSSWMSNYVVILLYVTWSFANTSEWPKMPDIEPGSEAF